MTRLRLLPSEIATGGVRRDTRQQVPRRQLGCAPRSEGRPSLRHVVNDRWDVGDNVRRYFEKTVHPCLESASGGHAWRRPSLSLKGEPRAVIILTPPLKGEDETHHCCRIRVTVGGM